MSDRDGRKTQHYRSSATGGQEESEVNGLLKMMERGRKRLKEEEYESQSESSSASQEFESPIYYSASIEEETEEEATPEHETLENQSGESGKLESPFDAQNFL